MAAPSGSRRGVTAAQSPATLGADQSRSPGASKYLADLPSRGLFSSTVISSNLLNKQRSEGKDGKAKAVSESNRGKRASERSLDLRSSVKKANIASGSSSPRQEDSKAFPTDKELQAFTVEKLRTLLKERGLSVKGKKDDLISRLKDD